jgi:1-acyl-sn-glycerol-3-phosphate acyltransferase
MPASAGAAQPIPGPIRYHGLRLALKAIVKAYTSVHVEGRANLPASGAYVICFNHPSWLDPPYLAAVWPDTRRRLYIFGPREADIDTGLRNRLIRWTRRGVHFKPGGADALDATRRSLAVLRAGDCLAVAGEGRLSDHEGAILPLETGVAHLARLADAVVLPTAIIGTRWIHLRSRVIIRIGAPISPRDYPAGRAGLERMTADLEVTLAGMLAGVPDRDPPGPLGRAISEAFNDRPWLETEDGH